MMNYTIRELTSTEAVRLEHALSEILAINGRCPIFDQAVITPLDTAHADVSAHVEDMQANGVLPQRGERDDPPCHQPRQRASQAIPVRVSSLCLMTMTSLPRSTAISATCRKAPVPAFGPRRADGRGPAPICPTCGYSPGLCVCGHGRAAGQQDGEKTVQRSAVHVVLSDDDDVGDEVDYDSPYDGDTLCINCNQPLRLCRGNCDNLQAADGHRSRWRVSHTPAKGDAMNDARPR